MVSLQARTRPWLESRLRLVIRGLVLYLVAAVAGSVVVNLMINSISLIIVGVGIFLVPVMAYALRSLAGAYRRLVTVWTGVRIDEPYLPEPPLGEESSIGDHWRRCVRILSDPATWREILWAIVDPVVGSLTALLPMALIVNGLWGFVLALPFVWQPLVDLDGTQWYLFVPVGGQAAALLTVPLGAAQIALALVCAPALMTAYGRWCRVMLGPTEKARLAMRVQHLTATRSDAVDTQSAELRRIERDLHDGAQARLVAMGMSLSVIERLLERDPAKARVLLAQAREMSAKALGELRDLVRGIHPPVLADRGLVDAVRALALENPLQVEVDADIPGRLEAPVESAAYFAIAEILANATKHSGAKRVWIELRHSRGHLRITVTDDGYGGAEPSPNPPAPSTDGTLTLDQAPASGEGSGLRGIERRLGTFDGVLALSSPPGGPTIVTMEVPCALSSPRTSLS
jgi:signal transduction histidine kinase